MSRSLAYAGARKPREERYQSRLALVRRLFFESWLMVCQRLVGVLRSAATRAAHWEDKSHMGCEVFYRSFLPW